MMSCESHYIVLAILNAGGFNLKGAVSALDEETMCPSSELNIGRDATSGAGWLTL